MAQFRLRRRSAETADRTETHPVDEVLPPMRMLALGVQHITAMYAGVVAPPLIVGEAIGLPPTKMALLIAASLFTAGLATALQAIGVWRIGARMPFVNGVTFASVAPMLAIVDQQSDNPLSVLYGAVLVAGVLAFFAAPYFSRLLRFLPPLVNGTVITLIGLSLMPTAIEWIAGDDPDAGDYAGGEKIALGAATFVLVVVLNRVLKGFWNRIALLIGLVVGTLIAWPLGQIDVTTFEHSPAFNLPVPFALSTPSFSLTAILSICIVMLVAMTESTADMIALGEIVDKPADEKTIAAGLRADGAGSALSAVFGGFTCSAFAQNIGLVALTRVRSRYVVATAGGVLVLLGLFPVVGAVISLVPQPVLGGAALVLFGSIAVSGVKTLSKSDLSDPFNALVVSGSIGIGMIPVVAPDFYENFPGAMRTVLDSGISTGCLAAILLNLLFNALREQKTGTDQDPTTAETSAPTPHAAAATTAHTPEQRGPMNDAAATHEPNQPETGAENPPLPYSPDSMAKEDDRNR